MRVVWDRHSEPRYRFSIDDNSFFLRDIAQKNYASLFDCFYLKMLRDLHTKYGAKFSLNIYYTTGDDFDLPQFPDRYKGEWRDNADWLRLAFHAYANEPDRPYQDAAAGEADRRPGPGGGADPPLRRRGDLRPAHGHPLGHDAAHRRFKPLTSAASACSAAIFTRTNGRWDVNYRWTTRAPSISRGTTPGRTSTAGSSSPGSTSSATTCRSTRSSPTLEPLTKDPNTAEIMDLFTHEQYFWPFYRNYLPDHPQRLDAAIRWVTEHGYKPVFFHEGFLGGRRSVWSPAFTRSWAAFRRERPIRPA